MKKLFSLFVVCCFLAMGCNNFKKQTFNSENLQGKYEIDLSSALSELASDEENQVAVAFASVFLSQIEFTVQFDGDKMILDGSGAVVNLINAFVDVDEKMPYVLDYKIVNDSVLCTRENENTEFTEIGVLRKMSESFDYLQFVGTNEDDEEIVLTMRKKY